MAQLSVLMIVHAVVETDPRVRKWAETLHARGVAVTTIGLQAGSGEHSLPWTHYSVSAEKPTETTQPANLGHLALGLVLSALAASLGLASSRLRDALIKAAARARRGESVLAQIDFYLGQRIWLKLWPGRWRSYFWRLKPGAARMLEVITAHREIPDIVVANDWDTLPVGAAYAETCSAKLIYDTHEFATQEFDTRAFRKWKRPLIRAVESELITKAHAVTTVSSGMADALHSTYRLSRPVEAIRNVPPYVSMPFRPSHDPVRLLYQGLIGPARGLEELIDAMVGLEGRYELVIRGPESLAGLSDTLRRRAQHRGVADRVKVQPPVAFADLVPAASQHDIGVMLLPDNTVQNRYALPNKLFEYMTAGLALLTTDLPEMRRLIGDTGAGWTIAELESLSISNTLQAITASQIDTARRQALIAATTQNWERESQLLLRLIDGLHTPPPAAP